MKNWNFILISLILLCSCSSEDKPSQANVSNSVSFTIKNSNGEDLLDIQNDHHIDPEGIQLYSFIDGKSKELFDGNLDYPKHFRIEKNLDGMYQIDLYPYLNFSNNPSITLISWGNGDTDTLKINNNFSNQSISNEKIWLNGGLLWERESNSIKLFELTK